jgi:cell division protein FtsB
VKYAIGILLIVLAALQQQIWFGQSGYFEQNALAARQAEQQERTDALAMRNAKMTAEVLALKSSTAAFESRARSELGMVREGEVFYLVPEQPAP